MANIHESEKRKGNFVKRTTGTALVVLGAGLGAGSLIESSPAEDVLYQANQQVRYLSDELRKEYGVRLVCTSLGVGSFPSVACRDEVVGSYPKEQKSVILRELEERYRAGEKRILESFDGKVLEEARSRQTVKSLLFFAGLLLMSSGAAILDAKSKEGIEET